MTEVNDATLVTEIKTRLGITGNYQDALILGYAKDVKAYMLDGGIDSTIVAGDESVGVIARGVADLWNYGSGEGKFSTAFFQRLAQLALKEVEVLPDEQL